MLDKNLIKKYDRSLMHYLYGGDKKYRLAQEIILGIGGVRMLKKLGFQVKKYHMNEGHAAFLTLELLHENKKDIEAVWDELHIWDFDAVKELCVFTTHTPVDAGHDKFPYELYRRLMGDYFPEKVLRELAGNDNINMTLLGFNLSLRRPGYTISSVGHSGYCVHPISQLHFQRI